MQTEKKNIFIAVIHDKKLNVRLQTLNNLISKLVNGFKIELIDVHNAEDIRQSDISDNVKLESPKTESFFDGLVKSMHVKQVSQALKHKTALERFIAQDDFDTMLVIEDDVLCGDNVEQEVFKAIEVLDKNPQIDALFLGAPTPRSMTEKNETLAPVLEYFRLLPTVDSYIIKKDKAITLLSNLLPFRYTVPIQYSFLAHQKTFKPYFQSPNIFINGSKYGVYVSTVDTNNKLFMNPEFNRLVALNTKTAYTQQEVEDVKDMVKKVPLIQHCDFQYQLGLFFLRISQFDKAKEFFDSAYKTYVDNDCILNSESEFLNNYARLFKFLQPDRDAIDKVLDAKDQP